MSTKIERSKVLLPFFWKMSAPLMLLICIGFNGNARTGKETEKTLLILKISCSGIDVSSRIMERTGSYGRNEGYLRITENICKQSPINLRVL